MGEGGWGKEKIAAIWGRGDARCFEEDGGRVWGRMSHFSHALSLYPSISPILTTPPPLSLSLPRALRTGLGLGVRGRGGAWVRGKRDERGGKRIFLGAAVNSSGGDRGLSVGRL